MSRRDHEYEQMNPRQRERMRPRKKGGAGGKVLAAVLGFLFGIIATVGGVAGVGYYFASTFTVKDTINKINELAGTQIDYKEYVTDEYANQTVIGLVGKLQGVSDDIQKNGGSFEKLNQISPMVKTAVETLAQTFCDYGSSMEKNDITTKLMGTNFDGLGLAVEEIVYSLQLGKLLESTNNLDKNDELMMYLCFGDKGENSSSGDYYIDNKGKVQINNPNKALTIGSLASGGLNDVISTMPLDSLLEESELNEDNPVMLALAYGTEGTHWDWNKGEVEMRQQVFTKGIARSEETFYDIDGNAVNASAKSETVYEVLNTEQDGSTTTAFYLKYDETANVYRAWKDETCTTTPYRYEKTTVGDLQSGSNDLIDGIELAPIFNVSLEDIKKAHDNDPKNNPDAIILALAYGEKGTHYDINASGEIVWKGNHKPRTIKDLTKDGGASALLDEIKLSTLLDISPLDKYTDPDNPPDPIMLALAFGEEGTHYNLTDTNADGTPDSIDWIGDSKERTVKDLTDENEGIFDDLTLSAVLELKPTDNKVMISLAYGKSSHYTVEGDKFVMNPIAYKLVNGTVYDDDYEAVLTNAVADGDDVYTLTKDNKTVYLKETDGVLYAYETKAQAITAQATDRITYKKTVLNDLTGSGASDLIDAIELGAALDVEITNTSDELLHALAYGYQDENYTLNGTTVNWLVQDNSTGKPYAPRTIKDLSDNSDEIFNSIRLATVLGAKIDDSSSDELLHALAFGYKDTHFRLHADGSVEWLTDENGEKYSYRTIDDLKNNSEAIFDDLRLATVLDVSPDSHQIIIALAYGTEGKDFDYKDVNNDGKIDKNDGKDAFQMKNESKPHTVKELKEGGGRDLLDNIELSSIFYKPDPEKDKIHMFLIYGKKDIHYSYTPEADGSHTIQMLQKRIAICQHDHKKVYDEYGHWINGGSVVSYTESDKYEYIYTDPNGDKYYLKKVDKAPFTELTDDSTSDDPYDEALFYYVFDENGNEVMFSSRTLGQLTQDKTLLDDISKALSVRDFLGDSANLDENFVLKHVADHKIDELPNAIEELTVQQVFEDEIYKHQLDNDNNLYFVDKDNKQLYFNSDDDTWYTSATFDEGTQSQRVLTGTWKYLLYKKDVEQTYLLSNINEMIGNMKENVQKATLLELYTDGLIRTNPNEAIAGYTIDDLITFVSNSEENGNS